MITAVQAIQKLPTDVNFSEEKLAANIPATEYRWGMQFLGTAFWGDLQENISTKLEYKVFWQQVLWEYMAWCLLYESRFSIQWSISTQGFMLNSTEYSQSDRYAYKNISSFLFDRVQLYQQKVNEFLTTWPSKFPLYGPNSNNCCSSKSEFIEDYFGVNVDGVDHSSCGCTDDNPEPTFPEYVPEPEALQQFNINCPGTIQITGLSKNNELLDTDLPKEFEEKNDVLAYLLGFDTGWALDGNYIKITSSDNWNLTVCCI